MHPNHADRRSIYLLLDSVSARAPTACSAKVRLYIGEVLRGQGQLTRVFSPNAGLPVWRHAFALRPPRDEPRVPSAPAEL